MILLDNHFYTLTDGAAAGKTARCVVDPYGTGRKELQYPLLEFVGQGTYQHVDRFKDHLREATEAEKTQWELDNQEIVWTDES